jgi:hypothetical protein
MSVNLVTAMTKMRWKTPGSGPAPSHEGRRRRRQVKLKRKAM